MNFSINNTRQAYIIGNVIALFFVPLFIALILSKWLLPDYFEMLFYGYIVLMVVFILPFKLLVWKKTDVKYDGLYVRYKTGSGEQVIDLNKTTSVKYGLQKGLPFRGKRNYIYLEVHNYNPEEKPVRIYDHVPEKDMDKIMDGFHFGYPLMLMYDDIIAKYPDKA